MSRWRQRFTETEIFAIGIEGDRDSLCGAIKRFERDGIQSNDEYDLCDECSVTTYKKQRNKCHCPKLERAINKLNKYFFKRMNNNNNVKKGDIKKFELIYKFPDCDGDYSDYCDEPPLFFLYISPCIISDRKCSINDDFDDMDNIPYHSCRLIHQVSVEEKLLFVDVMKFFGGFETKHEQPEFILYHCQEHEL
ncbi:unnamed protein product [Rotaria socialis]|uniref:Uncharacterized protein n=1 Tax=Rotaria socialis TaxID=392032 RepID=A0A821RLT8_9BILA|nr:unnamed protein product [Rotaria socialis]CAF4588144.1 unnamed protein product [Rotaria socialis]CAF4840510.1 unnamed protein product [Rotaria socialis]